MADENITVTAPKRHHDPNELRVVVDGVSFGGWQDVRVTRGVERMPSDFAVAITERYPRQTNQVSLRPGKPCKVYLGDDRVITGYTDTYAVNVGPRQHEVLVSGRGKCADLVDCAAGFNQKGPTGGQIGNAAIKAIASALAAPFGITVDDRVLDPGYINTQFNLIFGETVFEILDRCARYASRLVYEGADGNLILSQVSVARAASGFEEGVNLQSFTGNFSMIERFSDYFASLVGTDTLADIGDAGFLIGHIKDPGVPRFRPMVTVSSEMQQASGEALPPLAAAVATWECARRWARAQAVTVVCDSWRDSAGTLWTPNTLAKVKIPSLKLDTTWTISEVTYLRNDNGTTAQVILMPPEAFTPKPIAITSYDWQVDQALQGGAASPDGFDTYRSTGPALTSS